MRLQSLPGLPSPSLGYTLPSAHVTLDYIPASVRDDALGTGTAVAVEALEGARGSVSLTAIVSDERIVAGVVQHPTLLSPSTPETLDVDPAKNSDAEKHSEDTLSPTIPILHVTLSKASETVPSHYANVLLQRLEAAQVLSRPSNWTGLLPAVTLLDADGTSVNYPPTQASMTILPTPLVLSGLICDSTRYNPTTEACDLPKAECGFCLFMRAGPCGEAFEAWEKCLETCKDTKQDFIAVCGPQTLRLRDCTDENPEYYSVLNQGDDVEEETPNEDTTAVDHEETQPDSSESSSL